MELGVEDFTDDDRVVSSDVCGVQAAGHLTENIFHQRNIFRRPAEVNIQARFFALRLFGARKKFRKSLLLLLQNVNAKNALLLKQREQVSALIHTDGNERRIE